MRLVGYTRLRALRIDEIRVERVHVKRKGREAIKIYILIKTDSILIEILFVKDYNLTLFPSKNLRLWLR
jgi:hypothetical protein